MLHATPRARITATRALMLTAIAQYLDRARLQEAREGASELEIQKLAQFLQLLNAPLRLAFTRGRYGPHTEGLSHMLDALEGHHLTEVGDRSARVTEFAPINLMPESADAARQVVEADPDAASHVARLLSLVDGFETPNSLELLATVHFAAVQPPPTGEPPALADRVAGWSLRKARLFTEAHVRVAAARLSEHRLLPAEPPCDAPVS